MFEFQLECIACGHSWYASRDEASMLTIDGPNSAKSVGTAPWATDKFDEVEKKLVSPREPEKKASEAFIPVVDSHRKLVKPKSEENADSPKPLVKPKSEENSDTQRPFLKPKSEENSITRDQL